MLRTTGFTTTSLRSHGYTQRAEATYMLTIVARGAENLFERMVPGIEWKKNEIIEQSGQKWLLMEMTSRAIDTDIYNIMLATGYQGKMLEFSFNSTKEDFSKFENSLRASLNLSNCH